MRTDGGEPRGRFVMGRGTGESNPSVRRGHTSGSTEREGNYADETRPMPFGLLPMSKVNGHVTRNTALVVAQAPQTACLTTV